MGEHGFVHYIMERLPAPIVQVLFGEETAGLPSHEHLITSKIDEQSGDVMAIGWSHFERVLLMLISGILIGAFALFSEHLMKNAMHRRRTRPKIRVEKVREHWMKSRMRALMTLTLRD